MNQLNRSSKNDETDEKLILKTLAGDKTSLNKLIQRHQPYIYNIAWKMVGNPHDASDFNRISSFGDYILDFTTY